MRECMAGMCPPKRLRISELNPHLLCALCGGYLIDATTIIECLHSFCKTCILRYLETSNYCPICEVLIHKTRPWQNIRLDHALQNAVYKMVPGLFQNEMKRRREFYEQQNSLDKYGQSAGQSQGQIGDRIIFSQDEEFSVSIEFSPDGKPVKEAKAKHLKRPIDSRPRDKRYLKCPAGLRVAHLKKFIRSKFTLPQHIEIDLFHESEPLYDSYSLMDVAYIYLWKRDCVLQLFYSFFEVPTKKRKLQSVTHISETISKSSKVMDKPEKNFGDRKSSNKKGKPDSKKQSRMSGTKKSTGKAVTSSGNSASQQGVLAAKGVLVAKGILVAKCVPAAKGAVSSNLKRKHSDIPSTKDCSWLSRSGTTSMDTPSCAKIVRNRLDNMALVEKCTPVHTVRRSKQISASSECAASSPQCRESTNCSIISHHSRETTACSVTSHFCTENTQCSIVSRPCVTHSNRMSKTPADSEVSITLLIKSSDSNDYKHECSQTSHGRAVGRLQNGENTSQITYNTFLNGDSVSEIKDKSILAGGKFLEVKNTIHKKCKKESKVAEMNIQNGDVVSEVKVSVNGNMAPEMKNKQLMNGQFIFRVKNGTITNSEAVSKARDEKSLCNEPSVVGRRCQDGNKEVDVGSIKSGRKLSCEKKEVQECTIFDKKEANVHRGQGKSFVKIYSKDNLHMKCNDVHNGETTLGVTGEKLHVGRISNVKGNNFSNDGIAFDIKDFHSQSFEKIFDVCDKKFENNNKFCDKGFENSEVTSDLKDKKLIIADEIEEMKDEKLANHEISSAEKEKTSVQCKTTTTEHLCEQEKLDINSSPIKLERTMLPAPSQQHIVDREDKKLKTGSGKRDLNLSYDDQTPKMEETPSQPPSIIIDSGSEISKVSQGMQSGTCVDTDQVKSTSVSGDSPTTRDSENMKNVFHDPDKASVAGLKDPLPSTPDPSPVFIKKPSNIRSEKPKMLEMQHRVPCAKDVVGNHTKQNKICTGLQIPCVNNKVNSIRVHAKSPEEALSAKTDSLSNQRSSGGSSNCSECTILILPSLCSVKPNCVDKIRNSVSVSDTVPAAEPVTTTEHETFEHSVAKEIVSENLTCGSVKQRSGGNAVKDIEEQSRKQKYSPERFKQLSPSDHRLEKHDLSKSVNLLTKNVSSKTSKTVTVQAKQPSLESPVAPSDKPFTSCEVRIITSSHMPVPLKLVQSTMASIVSVACSSITSSLASTASTFPTTSSCRMSSCIGGASSLTSTSASSLTSTSLSSLNLTSVSSITSTSASSLTKHTATVKTTPADSTKPLPAKTSSPQPCTSATAASRTADAASRNSPVAVSSSATQNKCLSPYTMGKDGSHWSNSRFVCAGVSNTTSLSQDAPTKVITSAVTATSGSSEVALPGKAGPGNIPVTSTSAKNDATPTACVVSSFLNLPPATSSPMKRCQTRSHPDSTNSATDMTPPSEATKLDNFLFDVTPAEKEISNSYSQNRVSSSCGKETQKSQFRSKLNSLTELGGVSLPKYSKTKESLISTLHHLPKTVSQTARPYVSRSFSTSPSSNTKYSNIIQTTKISTLIPKSSSVNSKAGAFSKSPSYPTSVNSLLLSRSIMTNSLSPHYPRIVELSATSGTSCISQELTPKSSALPSPPSSTTSSLLPSTTSTYHHKMPSAARQSSKGISGKSDKSHKHRTIPPLCIPKSSLTGPTTLKLQRSPGTNDHYIFSPLLHYSPASQHKVERSKAKDSKHKTSHAHKSAHSGAKGNGNSGGRQRVPTIKISDINRNPVIVENGGSGNGNNNSHFHSPYKPYSHGGSRAPALENATPRAHSQGRNEGNSSTGRHDKMPVRDILRRPSDSELLLSRHWHAYSTAELLFSGFSLPAHSKLHELQYDTDAMPLDYSQSSSKS